MLATQDFVAGEEAREEARDTAAGLEEAADAVLLSSDPEWVAQEALGAEPGADAEADAPAENSLKRVTSKYRRTKARWLFSESHRPNLLHLDGIQKRRLLDVDSDGVHRKIDSDHILPAQLYSTESGRLFHAGQVVIVLVGLPARGKTHLTVLLTRYLRWLGVRTHAFHMGDYRRANDELDPDFFRPVPQTEAGRVHRKKVTERCTNDVMNFFLKDKGQVAIYDAVNALPEHRAELHGQFTKLGIKTLFIELLVTDKEMIAKNIKEAVMLLPDYQGWDKAKATVDYTRRIEVAAPFYTPMDKSEKLPFIQTINFGDRVVLNDSHHGYLMNRIVFFLINTRIKNGRVYFARCHKNFLKFKLDPELDEEGIDYARKLTKCVVEHVQAKRGGDALFNRTLGTYLPGGTVPPLPGTMLPPAVPVPVVPQNMGSAASAGDALTPRSSTPLAALAVRQKSMATDGVFDDLFVIWTSTRRRTRQTCEGFRKLGIPTRQRVQLLQKNPGDVENMLDAEIQERYPEDYVNHQRDPYHHRYSRAELYHDLAVKIEPLIMEMERMSGDLLVIADETVLQVLYGYLMSCSCYDIPSLEFPTNELVEIQFNAYSNTARRVVIPGVEP